MLEQDFFDGDDGLSPTLFFHLESAKSRIRTVPNPNLVFPAAKNLNKIGGTLVRPHDKLLFWDKGHENITPLGRALVDYTALTVALFPDERFFTTGQLLDYGYKLANELQLSSWHEFLRVHAPDLAGLVEIEVQLSPLQPGSFKWIQRIVPLLQGAAAATAILANAPEAVENVREIYLPQAHRALEVAGDFTNAYVKGLEEILDVSIQPRPPQLPSPSWQPELEHQRRRQRKRKA